MTPPNAPDPADVPADPKQPTARPAPAASGTTTGTPANARPAAQQTARKHVSVVYFHGIGSQRRYEEISRLVDCLDKFAHANLDRVGMLFDIKPAIETPRPPLKKDVTAIRTKHVLEKRDTDAWFYEVYWAPLTAGGVPSAKVLKWMMGQIPHPIAALRTPWRLRARLRRASLLSLQAFGGTSIDEEDVRKLAVAYDDFEGPDAWRVYSKGSFKDFKKFLSEREAAETIKDGKAAGRLKLAEKWRRYSILQELRNLFVLLTIGLTALLGLGILAFGIIVALKWMSTTFAPALTALKLSDSVAPTVKNVSAILVAILTVFGVGRFLSDYLGDVEVWSTYEETDRKFKKREEILEAGAGMLQHVLRDPQCERVVVVGHSLGTAVAFDSLLEVGRFNRARPNSALDVDKLAQFITLGSPIDKIHYFFESYQGRYHRYNRVVEDLRGDLGTTPFSKNRKPQIHWINFWDQADLVSGSLETASNRRLIGLCVDNCEVASYGFPAPGKSHSGYFIHRDVLEVIFGAIFGNKHAFSNAPLIPHRGYDYKSQFVGRGAGLQRTQIIQALMLLIPWIAASDILFWFLQAKDAWHFLLYCGCGIAGVIFLAWTVGRPWSHRKPIC